MRETVGHKSFNPVTFKPVLVRNFAKNILWKHSPFALGMSATIMGAQAMAIDLGLHSWDVEVSAMPSPFPIETRLVKYCPVAAVTYKNGEEPLRLVSEAIMKILAKHPNDKVLVHAVNYDMARYLQETLKPPTHAMMFHNRTDRTVKLEEFKMMRQPAVLVSPSMERGVDLPGDLCRIVIVAKIPYANLKSPQVAKRLHGYSDGSLWYARKTARSLVQMTGRATRFLGDWSISYILDTQFGVLANKYKEIFPTWWRESVKYIDPKEL